MLKGLVLSSGKQDLILNPPIMNSAGILGFAPDPKLPFDVSQLGAFTTHPLSLRRRVPAKPTRLNTYPGGFLLHTGLPNPGLRRGLKECRKSWGTFNRPIIAHIIADSSQDTAAIVEVLEEADHSLHALEIGFERGLPDEVMSMLTPLRESQLPLLARVPLGTDNEVIQAVIEAGVNAIVIGPPRGSILNDKGDMVSGRLFGPGLLPLALNELEMALQNFDVHVILGCGLFSVESVRTAFTAGAAGVQLDTVLWVDPTSILDDIQALFSLENQGDP